MRKSSKILALILTLALLCGALAVAAFATEEETDSVTPTIDVSNQEGTIQFYRGSDFEGTSFTRHHSGTTGELPKEAGDCAVNVKSHTHFDSRDYMGNTYAAFWFNKNETNAVDSTKSADTYHDIFIAYGGTDTSSTAENITTNSLSYDATIIKNDFVVFDYDFGADKYLTSAGALTDTLEEGATLSYATNFNLGLGIRGHGTTWQFNFGGMTLKFAKDSEGKWYIYNHNNSSHKAYLSDKVGEWNHLTLVAEINNKIDITIDGQDKIGIKFIEAIELAKETGLSEADAKAYVMNNAKNYQIFDSEIHMFLNGQYFGSYKFLTDHSEKLGEKGYFEFVVDNKTYYVSPAHFYFNNLRLTDSSNANYNYSFALDNIATHFYKSGYTDTANGRTLGDYMSSDSYTTKNLAYCEDVVFNGGYQMPNPNTYVASVKIGEETTGYYTKQGAEDALVEGATLIVHDGTKFEDFIVTFPFYVQISDPNNFTIRNSGEGGYGLEETTTPNLYVIKPYDKIGKVEYELYSVPFAEWGDQYVESGVLLLGGKYEHPEDSKYTIPATVEKNPELKDGLFTQFDGWDMYYKVSESEKDEEGVVEDELFGGYWRLAPATTITTEIIANNSIVYIFPRFVEVQYAYSIIDAETGLVVEGVDYTKANEIASSVNSAIAVKEGSYIVTLYTDVELKKSTGEAVGIKATAGRAIYFDLNGHDYVANFDVHGAKVSSFYVEADAEFYLYSSKEGGRAFNFTYTSGYTKAYGAALFGTSGSENPATAPKIYCGTVNDTVGVVTVNADGDNLWTSSALLIEAGTSVAYYNVYNVDETGAIIDSNSDGKITSADKKANATTYYNEIHIDGGTYTRANSDGGGLVKTNAYLDVDIKNATLIAANIFATDSRYNPRITGTVDNTICYAIYSSVFGQFCEGSTLTFKDSTLLGGLGFAGCTYSWTGANAKYTITSGHPMNVNSMLGEVYLGEGCKIYGETTAQIKPAEGVHAVDINEVYRENTVWYAPSYSVVDTIVTFDSDSINTPTDLTKTYNLVKGYTAKDEFATINWISAGKTIESVQVPVIGPVFYSFELMPTVDTATSIEGTNLFRLGVDHWTMNGNAMPSNFVLEEGKTLDFTAVMGGIVAPNKTDLKPVKQYFDMAAKYTGNIYVPHYEATEVVVDGVTYKISASTWTVGGKGVKAPAMFEGEMYCLATVGTYASAFDLDNGAYSIVLTYTVTKVEEGKDDVVETMTLNYSSKSLAEYFIEVFKQAETDEQKALAANCIQYSMLYYQYQKDYAGGKNVTDRETTHYNKLVAFITENSEAYNKAVTDIHSESFNSKVTNSAAKTADIPVELADYISSIILYNNGGVLVLTVVPVKNVVNGDTLNLAPTMTLTSERFGDDKPFSVTLDVDVYNKKNGGDKYVEYFDAKGNVLSGQNWSGATGYFNNVNSHLFANVATNILNIKLTTVDKVGEEFVENTYTIQYTLSDYVVAMEATGNEADADAAELVRGFLAVGEAAIDFVRAK